MSEIIPEDFDRYLSFLRLSLPLAGVEEHLMVHREVTDRNLTGQFAHPGGHPHHPIQHDPDKGELMHLLAKTTMHSEIHEV